jgi:hypothetical protein
MNRIDNGTETPVSDAVDSWIVEGIPVTLTATVSRSVNGTKQIRFVQSLAGRHGDTSDRLDRCRRARGCGL